MSRENSGKCWLKDDVVTEHLAVVRSHIPSEWKPRSMKSAEKQAEVASYSLGNCGLQGFGHRVCRAEDLLRLSSIVLLGQARLVCLCRLQHCVDD
jgi:hypothetical protein